MTKYFKFIVVLLALTFSLTAAEAAVTTPAKAVVNPRFDVAYLPNNSGANASTLDIQQITFLNWEDHSSLALPGRCYGIAAWQSANGGRLLVSVDNGANSVLRYYKLDPATGLPADPNNPKDLTIAVNGTNLRGVSIVSDGSRAYVADNGNLRLYYFDYDAVNDKWTRAGFIQTNELYLYDVVTTPVANQKYKIIVSTGSNPGKILVYTYNNGALSNPAADSVKNLVSPTYLRTNLEGTRLYVSVQGNDSDIRQYDIADNVPMLANVKTIASFPGTNNWTGFDISWTEKYIFYTQLKLVLPNPPDEFIYRAPLPLSQNVSVDLGTVQLVEEFHSRDYDNIIGNHAFSHFILFNSRTGSSWQVDYSGGPAVNHDPQVNTLKQFRLDGITEIEDSSSINEKGFKARFVVTDDNNDLITPIVRYNLVGGPTSEVRGTPVASGTTVEMAINDLAEGNYKWRALGTDTATINPSVVEYFVRNDKFAFQVDTIPPGTINDLKSVSGYLKGSVNMRWTTPGDDGNTGTFGQYVYAYSYAGPVTTLDKNIDPNVVLISSTRPGPNTPTAGQLDSRLLSGLNSGADIWTAVCASDEAGNIGLIGNSPKTTVSTEDHLLPIIGTVTPNSSQAGQTVTVTITGSNFVDGAEVILRYGNFEEILGRDAKVVNGVLTVTFDLPANATPAGWRVVVVNPDGGYGSKDNGFRIGGVANGGVIALAIARDADIPNSSVTVSWKTNPNLHSSVDIYTIVGDFSTDASKWLKVNNPTITPKGDLDTYTDANQVGNGTNKYYKIISANVALTDNDLKTDVVGKFDIAVGPADTQPEKSFISIPLDLSNYTPANAIGAQANEADSITIIDNTYVILKGEVFEGGQWKAIEGTPDLNLLSQGQGYVYATLTVKNITIVGKVKEAAGSREINTGIDVSRQPIIDWIGNYYPQPVAITSAGLNGTSTGPDPLNAAVVQLIDANAVIVGNTYTEHRGAESWVDNDGNPSIVKLLPGRGYMISDLKQSKYNWTQNRP